MRLLSVLASIYVVAISLLWNPGPASAAQPRDGKTIFRFDT